MSSIQKVQEKRNDYWFILDNYVHLSVKGTSALFYNTLNGEIVEYTDNETVLKLARRLSSKKLLVVHLKEEDLADPAVARFVHDMRAHFMGDLIDTSLSKGKPIQMMPVVKVQKDVEKIKKLSYGSVGENMLKYLAEISLYINSACSLDCDMCTFAYKQFLCCTRSPQGKQELPMSSIKGLFEQLAGVPRARVNILGGDIFKFSRLAELVTLLNEQPHLPEKVFYIHYANLFGQEEQLGLFPPGSSTFRVLVTFPVDRERWQQVLAALRSFKIDSHFLFITAKAEEVGQAEELISLFELENYSFCPVFNGRNLAFFEENIFLDRDDIQEARPTTREILARQVVNPLHFGTLTILSSGRIHANVNVPRLGTLGRDGGGIHQAVYREMIHGRSWRRIRKRVEPCKRCTFEALCPPLSNYEYALGENNLCHTWGSTVDSDPVRRAGASPAPTDIRVRPV